MILLNVKCDAIISLLVLIGLDYNLMKCLSKLISILIALAIMCSRLDCVLIQPNKNVLSRLNQSIPVLMS